MLDYMPLMIASIPAIGAIITTVIVNLGTRKDVKLNLLRLQILSKELPVIERMRLYDEYVREKGNGYMKSYYDTVLKPLCDAETRSLESFRERRVDK